MSDWPAIRLELVDEHATTQLGADIALAASAGDVLCLRGGLGTGKSTLARGLVRLLADDQELEVPSPSYTLCQEYDLAIPVRHFDLYRLGDAGELDELGIEEGFETAVTVIEWPDISSGRLPGNAVFVTLEMMGKGRLARIDANSAGRDSFAEKIFRSLQIRTFLDRYWQPSAARKFLEGDASTRRYETAQAGCELRIVMDAPRRPDGPAVYDGKSYSRVARLAEDVVPYIAVGGSLLRAGMAAPRIFASDVASGLALVEHLGEGRIVDGEGKPVPERYRQAARLLAQIHGRDWPTRLSFVDSAGRTCSHEFPPYDRPAMMIETSLFADWYVPAELGRTLTASERRQFEALWSKLIEELAGSRHGLVLRDFHSPNLIWREAERFPFDIGLLDFQDAVIGPIAYDLASLAQDARVDISPELEKAVCAAYVDATASDRKFDTARFRRDYAILAAQRATKILGIFMRLNIRDGKPAYLAHLPRMRGYLQRSLAEPALAAYRAWCREMALLPQ